MLESFLVTLNENGVARESAPVPDPTGSSHRHLCVCGASAAPLFSGVLAGIVAGIVVGMLSGSPREGSNSLDSQIELYRGLRMDWEKE